MSSIEKTDGKYYWNPSDIAKKKKVSKYMLGSLCLNHIHLLVSSEDMISFLRDFKRHTTREMKNSILTHEPRTMNIFETPNGFRFWEETNMPEKVETPDFFKQKYDYIHMNPVKKEYVKNPEDWVYSSANPNRLLDLTVPIL